MRGTRIVKDGTSTHDLLIPLKREFFSHKVKVGFWHHPDTGVIKGKLAQTNPLREIFGVHHIKAHVFDNNVMITGANLSEDYFTDRQDRCMVIQDCEQLADWFDDLLGILIDCSLQLTENGNLKMQEQYPSPEKNAKAFKEQMSHHLRFFRFNHKTNVEV
jgi:CDP-diacylglycerol---glycerol-3-phosphate 3-phosphatidyltransferase